MEDMGDDPVRERDHLRASGDRRARQDPAGERPTDQYATRHNPFVYFHSIIDSPRCAARRRRSTRLQRATCDARRRTPNLSFITPGPLPRRPRRDLRGRRPGGLRRPTRSCGTWVPADPRLARLRATALLVDHLRRGRERTPSACCGEQPGPNTPAPAAIDGPGGGAPARCCSRRFITPGTVTERPTTTTRCCAPSRTRSASPTSATPARPDRAFGSDVFTSR